MPVSHHSITPHTVCPLTMTLQMLSSCFKHKNTIKMLEKRKYKLNSHAISNCYMQSHDQYITNTLAVSSHACAGILEN